jgi:hypothetical protein
VYLLCIISHKRVIEEDSPNRGIEEGVVGEVSLIDGGAPSNHAFIFLIHLLRRCPTIMEDDEWVKKSERAESTQVISTQQRHKLAKER